MTKYEEQMYHDIHSIAESLKKIANILQSSKEKTKDETKSQ